MDPLSSVSYLDGYDSIPDNDIVLASAVRLAAVERGAARVEENFRRIAEIMQADSFSQPPMRNPHANFSFAQTGASVGSKINPFYKVPMQHNGLDIIAPSGEPVLVTADGTVSNVIRHLPQ